MHNTILGSAFNSARMHFAFINSHKYSFLIFSENPIIHPTFHILPYYINARGVFRGEGLWGLSPPPGPVKSIDLRGFSGPNRR